VKLCRTTEGRYVVLDVMRMRGSPDEVEDCIKQTAALDGQGVTICLPQDPGAAGKSQVAYLTRVLAPRCVISSVESGKKDVRAMQVISQRNVGNLMIVDDADGPRGRNQVFLQE
jgi:predicted phage terminase large subunit-like protein